MTSSLPKSNQRRSLRQIPSLKININGEDTYFGSFIKNSREKVSLTQKQLAFMVGITRGRLSMIESNKIFEIPTDLCIELCLALGQSFNKIEKAKGVK